jgi:hypothetical protein
MYRPAPRSSSVVLAPTLSLAAALPTPVLTVEAEYGSVVVEGTAYTAAHHQKQGPFAGRHVVEGGRPSPCNDANIPVVEEGVVLVSHVDLDTLGGVWRGQGRNGLFLSYSSFWDLAEFVDVRGPHKLGQSGANEADLDRLYAFWAYSKGLPRFSRDQVTDITDVVNAAAEVMAGILCGDKALLAAGAAFRAAEEELNEATFSEFCFDSGVMVRVAQLPTEFCNHLYRMPSSFGPEVGRVVICHNLALGSITVSLADPIPGFSCRDVVQDLWGPEAGGHDGIAGSPRGREMTRDDLSAAIAHVEDELEDCRTFNPWPTPTV